MSKQSKRKKNFNKTPRSIVEKLKQISQSEIIVAVVLKIPESRIAGGEYAHLGIKMVGDEVQHPSSMIPSPTVGRYSDTNCNGKEVVRKDLPKETKEFSVEVPNWGDWYNGSHEMTWQREVYQRDFIPPKELDIEMQLLEVEDTASGKNYVMRFEVNEVINRESEGTDEDVFFGLNLLQENVGAVDVFPADASYEDFLKTTQVDWEILPVGERGTEGILEKLERKYSSAGKEIRERLGSRFELLANLKPEAFINGTNGFRRYFGARFADDLVVFENLEHGNAIYVMFKDWEGLSKLSRLRLMELMKTSKNRVCERIVHRGNWEDRLKVLIEEELHLRKTAQEAKDKNVASATKSEEPVST